MTYALPVRSANLSMKRSRDLCLEDVPDFTSIGTTRLPPAMRKSTSWGFGESLCMNLANTSSCPAITSSWATMFSKNIPSLTFSLPDRSSRSSTLRSATFSLKEAVIRSPVSRR